MIYTGIMKIYDKLFLGFIFGFPAPFILFSLGLVLWMFLFRNSVVYYFVIPGFFSGIILDILFLKKLIRNAFDLSQAILISLYVFYSVMSFGFFMGFPVPNLIVGPIAAYFIGLKWKIMNTSEDQREKSIRPFSLFCGLIMFIICLLTALMGLSQKEIGLELKGMLGLNFDVTRTMIWALILIGGSFLVVCQYFLSRISLLIILKMTHNKSL